MRDGEGLREWRIDMNSLRKMLATAAFALIVAAFIPVAKADEGDWATKVTIDQPVQIGNMVLTPGSYTFRLVDIWAPNVVAIYDANQGKYEGMIMGTPVYRWHASEKTTLVFEKTVAGAPEALQCWYYPDSNIGIEFPIPHTKTAYNAPKTAHISG
jgi:hypothetical protein